MTIMIPTHANQQETFSLHLRKYHQHLRTRRAGPAGGAGNRESVEELKPEPGAPVIAVIESANVVVEKPCTVREDRR